MNDDTFTGCLLFAVLGAAIAALVWLFIVIGTSVEENRKFSRTCAGAGGTPIVNTTTFGDICVDPNDFILVEIDDE